MKVKIAKFMLFVYLNYIQEDWEIYKPFLRVIIRPAWFIRSTLVWILSPFLIPEYLFKNSKFYSKFIEFKNLEQVKQIQQMNKVNTRSFLNKKKRS